MYRMEKNAVPNSALAHIWQNLPIFWNWPPKNISDQQKRVAFQKLQKVLNHSALLYTM